MREKWNSARKFCRWVSRSPKSCGRCLPTHHQAKVKSCENNYGLPFFAIVHVGVDPLSCHFEWASGNPCRSCRVLRNHFRPWDWLWMTYYAMPYADSMSCPWSSAVELRGPDWTPQLSVNLPMLRSTQISEVRLPSTGASSTTLSSTAEVLLIVTDFSKGVTEEGVSDTRELRLDLFNWSTLAASLSARSLRWRLIISCTRGCVGNFIYAWNSSINEKYPLIFLGFLSFESCPCIDAVLETCLI